MWHITGILGFVTLLIVVVIGMTTALKLITDGINGDDAELFWSGMVVVILLFFSLIWIGQKSIGWPMDPPAPTPQIIIVTSTPSSTPKGGF